MAADSWVKVNYLRYFELFVAMKVIMGGGKFDLVGTVDELLNFSGSGVCWTHVCTPTHHCFYTSQMYITGIDARIFF